MTTATVDRTLTWEEYRAVQEAEIRAILTRAIGLDADASIFGLHRGLPMDDYLALPCMSASRLELLRRSPKQYRHALTAEQESTDALERGTALHLAILEPALFETRYVIAEPCEATLKSGQRKGELCRKPGVFRLRDGFSWTWACGQHVRGFDLPADDSGAETVSAEIHAAVLAMRNEVLADPLAASLFEGSGEFEATVIAEDASSGVIYRIRPDRLVRRVGMHTSLKSSRDASPFTFPIDAERRGHFRALALYRRGLRAIGWPYASTSVLAVESKPPFDLACYLLDEADLNDADREVNRLLARYRMCQQDNQFPGYSPGGFIMLQRPKWARDDKENRDG